MLNDNLKIAALVPYPVFPAKMGGQKGIVLFYKYLSALTPVTFFTIKGNPSPDGMDIHCIPIMGNHRFRYCNPFLFFRMRRLLRKTGTTHLILEHPYFGWLGFMLKKFTSIKIIVHSHNIEAQRFRSTGKWWWGILWHYEKQVHRMADENFFISAEDRKLAIELYGLSPEKCHTITYGIEDARLPETGRIAEARNLLMAKHGIGAQEKILLYNGTLDYLPNQKALDAILFDINPKLMASGIDYKIIICGKNLPASYRELSEYRDKNIIYAGFVEDIGTYFLGADIFLNTVLEGGGIKTKLVEALAANLHAVSTETGAFGVPPETAGRKLILVRDGNWEQFAAAIIAISRREDTPASFYSHFYWGHIAEKAFTILRRMAQSTL